MVWPTLETCALGPGLPFVAGRPQTGCCASLGSVLLSSWVRLILGLRSQPEPLLLQELIHTRDCGLSWESLFPCWKLELEAQTFCYPGPHSR